MNFSAMKHFRFSIIFTLICLAIAGWWGLTHGPQAGIEAMFKALAITGVLAVMEVSLSFDNAVVNASVLRNWNAFWVRLFLTVGILVAVFGMRLLFPLLIVGVTADMSMIEVAKLALNDPKTYSDKLLAHHAEIAAFGGMFLILVFLNFFFDDSKDEHWFRWVEQRLSGLGQVDAISIFVALGALLSALTLIPSAEKLAVLEAGVWGIVVYLGVNVLGHLLEGSDDETTADGEDTPVTSPSGSKIVKAGIGGFLYLEVLDASFSFDGVIGAFAITSDVVIIMLGLAIGAMFVRALTVYLVEKGTLDAYVFLEHGAHYAIGALAVIMLLSMHFHIPEVVTGLIGVAFIVWSVMASISHAKHEEA
ncbi:MAG: hypothetical protein RLY58_1319 [Pseudomonadota bacterium]|jgi:hypothetical protein